MKVGYIGLGHLGSAMAGRLISQEVDLIVWNRTTDKASGLGAEIAASPSEVISASEIVFLNLFDSAAVREVLTGQNGILQGDCRGKIVIDTTTNHFEAVAGFHELLTGNGGYYLESPVLGSVVPASQGALTVLVSGDSSAFDKARPLLEKVGKSIFYLGKPSLATRMKLVNNLVLGSFMATLAEALAFGEDAGIEKAQVLDILASGAGNSLLLNAKKEKLLRDDFSTHFSSALIYKDLHYLQDLARTLKRPLFTGSVAKELFALTLNEEMEHLDFSVLYRVIKKM